MSVASGAREIPSEGLIVVVVQHPTKNVKCGVNLPHPFAIVIYLYRHLAH
ncbi:MAG: hypothetical protein WDO73_03050 [Ignavibacteriota bacterium]